MSTFLNYEVLGGLRFPETMGVPPRFSDIAGIRQEFELSDRYIIQTAYAPNMGEAGQTSRTVIQGEFKFNGKELVSGTIASKIDVSSTGAISGKVFTTPVKVVFSEIDGVWGDL